MQLPRILLVGEDVSFYRSLLEEMGPNSFEIIQANDYSEARARLHLEDCDYAAAIVDVKTPQQISKIQELRQNFGIPIIVTSFLRETPFLLDLFRVGTFAFVHKPIDNSDVVDFIKCAAVTRNLDNDVEVLSATSTWLEINIPAAPVYIVSINCFVARIMPEMEERERQRILYALRELIQNAIEHGSKNCSDKKVNVRYLKTNRFLLFGITDQGNGFDFNSLPHAAVGKRKSSPIEVMEYRKKTGMRPGGLGISSVLGIADELKYNQAGNAVVMIKYLR